MPLSRQELLRCAERIDRLNSMELQQAGEFLESIALDRVQVEKFAPEEKTVLRNLYSAHETAIEKDFVNRLLTQSAGLTAYSLWNRFQRLTGAELANTACKPADKIAFVGSGPFPVSAISYVLRRPVFVSCIDAVADAIEDSRRVVEMLGLSKSISFEHSPGQKADFSAYDVIVIAVLARPKLPILQRICETAKSGALVAVRTAYKGCDSIYEPFKGPFPARVAPYAEHVAGLDDTISCKFCKCG